MEKTFLTSVFWQFPSDEWTITKKNKDSPVILEHHQKRILSFQVWNNNDIREVLKTLKQFEPEIYSRTLQYGESLKGE